MDRDRRRHRGHAPGQRPDALPEGRALGLPRRRAVRDARDHLRRSGRRPLPRSPGAPRAARQQLDHAGPRRRGRERPDRLRPLPRRIGLGRDARGLIRARAQGADLGRRDLQRRVPRGERLGRAHQSLPRPHRLHPRGPRAARADPHREPAGALGRAEHRALGRHGLAPAARWSHLDDRARDHVAPHPARRRGGGPERGMEHLRDALPQRRGRVAALLRRGLRAEPTPRRLLLGFHPPRPGAESRGSRDHDRGGRGRPLLARRDLRLLHRRELAEHGDR